jgi:hypothetical protein
VAALVIAGLLSALLSLDGLGIAAWGGFPKPEDRLMWWGLVMPLLISFPMFLLSLGVSRVGILGLWAALIMHLSFGLEMHWDFTKKYALAPILLFVAQAGFVTYGAGRFQRFRADHFIMRRFGADVDRAG